MIRNFILAGLLAVFCLVSCGDEPTDDTTNPEVTIIQPSNGASVAAGNVSIQAEATDDEEIDVVEFFVDGTKIGEDSTAAASIYTYVWNATGQTPLSAHTIRVRALDTSGNDDEATVSITIASGGGGPTYHSDNITGAETWWPSGNPHIVTADIAVWNGGALTIKPGCVVKFDLEASIGCGWVAPGTIVAVGKADSTILFTSNDPTPAAGDWEGLAFFEGTTTTNHFSYCTIEYAGHVDGQAVYVAWGAALKMDHSTIRNSAGRGIYYEHAGHVEEFNHNTITDCADYPLALDPEYVRYLGAGNDYTGNATGHDAIEVYYGGVETSGTWRDQGVPYRIKEDSQVWVGSTTTPIILTIEAGTTIEFEANAYLSLGYTILAGIIAEGTVTNPITFTSAADSPSPGDWRQLWIASEVVDAQCRLSYCVFEYGGAGEGDLGLLVVSDAIPEIDHCSFGHSSSHGIYLEGVDHPDTAALESENTFYDNPSGDVYLLP